MVKAIAEIVAKDNPEVAAALALVDIGKLAYKANIYVAGPLSRMVNNFGSTTFQKIWNAMKKNANILDMDLTGNLGLRIGKSMDVLWQDLIDAFGNPSISAELAPKNGVYFSIGSVTFTFYPIDYS